MQDILPVLLLSCLCGGFNNNNNIFDNRCCDPCRGGFGPNFGPGCGFPVNNNCCCGEFGRRPGPCGGSCGCYYRPHPNDWCWWW